MTSFSWVDRNPFITGKNGCKNCSWLKTDVFSRLCYSISFVQINFVVFSSFGKQPLWYDGRRGSECLILEHSEMIVVSFVISSIVGIIIYMSHDTVNKGNGSCPLLADFHLLGK